MAKLVCPDCGGDRLVNLGRVITSDDEWSAVCEVGCCADCGTPVRYRDGQLTALSLKECQDLAIDLIMQLGEDNGNHTL